MCKRFRHGLFLNLQTKTIDDKIIATINFLQKLVIIPNTVHLGLGLGYVQARSEALLKQVKIRLL